eukprot:7624019-Alexandrium_andersonii.AAC.1
MRRCAALAHSTLACALRFTLRHRLDSPCARSQRAPVHCTALHHTAEHPIMCSLRCNAARFTA